MPTGLESLSASSQSKPSGYNSQMQDLRDRLDQVIDEISKMKSQIDELGGKIEPLCEYFHH